MHDPKSHGDRFGLILKIKFSRRNTKPLTVVLHCSVLTIETVCESTECLDIQVMVSMVWKVFMSMYEFIEIGKVSIEIDIIGIRSTDEPIQRASFLCSTKNDREKILAT